LNNWRYNSNMKVIWALVQIYFGIVQSTVYKMVVIVSVMLIQVRSSKNLYFNSDKTINDSYNIQL